MKSRGNKNDKQTYELLACDKPMRLDDFVKLNEHYAYIDMFDNLQQSDYFVVPFGSVTLKLYKAFTHLDNIAGIKQFYRSSQRLDWCNVKICDKEISDEVSGNNYLLLKITKQILDKLLHPEDISKEYELLKYYSNNNQFIDSPAKSLSTRDIKKWYCDRTYPLELAYDWQTFQANFHMKFKKHGFELYKVSTTNKINIDQLQKLHNSCLFYPSNEDGFGFLCYPKKDKKNILNLDDLTEKEKSQALAVILGIDLGTEDTTAPNNNNQCKSNELNCGGERDDKHNDNDYGSSSDCEGKAK